MICIFLLLAVEPIVLIWDLSCKLHKGLTGNNAGCNPQFYPAAASDYCNLSSKVFLHNKA